VKVPAIINGDPFTFDVESFRKTVIAAAQQSGGGVGLEPHAVAVSIQGKYSPFLVVATIHQPSASAALAVTQGIDIEVAKVESTGKFLGYDISPTPAISTSQEIYVAPSPPPPYATDLALMPGCLCDNFRNGLHSDEYGKHACTKDEVHGMKGIKTFCMMPPRPYIPFLDNGCPSDMYRCIVTNQPQLNFPVCKCDKLINGAVNDFVKNKDGLCQKPTASGEQLCSPRNYFGDKKIGGSEFYGCPEDTFRCTAG